MAITTVLPSANGRCANAGSISNMRKEVFAGPVLERPDDRYDYGELRVITVGYLRGRMVILVWTPRGDAKHIISMRKANEREKTRYSKALATYR